MLVFDAFISKRVPPKHEIAAVGVLCMGVTLATIADGSVSTSLIGLVVAVAAIAFTAVYQVQPCPNIVPEECTATGCSASFDRHI